jgi:hypothetical protein
MVVAAIASYARLREPLDAVATSVILLVAVTVAVGRLV